MTWLIHLGDIVRVGAAGALTFAGLALMIAGAVGVLRFPDFYTRLHAWVAANGSGAAIALAGLALATWEWRTMLKLALLAILSALLAPLVAQLLSNAAHAGGLAPLSGPYVAPRPGAGKQAQ